MIEPKTCSSCGQIEPWDGDPPTTPLGERVLAWWRAAPCTACVRRIEAKNIAADSARRHAERLKRSHLPVGLQGLSFADMDPSGGRAEVIEQAQRWSRGQARRIFLQSRPGTGKTRLAATATWRALSDRQVIWVNLPTLITEAATRYGSDERKRAEQMLTSKAAIVLDDLGNENPSAWVRQMLQAVLESRLANEQMIFITSNMPVPQLAARYNDSQGRGGDWLASRLATFKQYVMPGVDRRLTLDI